MRKKSIRGRLGTEPNPIDVHVGNRVRMYRTLKGLSQERLGQMLGLTFQQVQKYEKGFNRIGASRLWDISQVLETPVGLFYEGITEEKESLSPRHLSEDLTADKVASKVAQIIEEADSDPLNRRETLDLVHNYYRIANRDTARQIFSLIKSLSFQPDGEDEDTKSE